MSTWAEIAHPGERPPGDAIRSKTNRPDSELEGDSALRTSPSDITRTPHLTTAIEPRTITYETKEKRKGPRGGARKKGGLAGEGPDEAGSSDSIYPRRSGWLSWVVEAPADDDHHNHIPYATPHARWGDEDAVGMPPRPRSEDDVDDEVAELPQRTPWGTAAEGSAQAGIMPCLRLSATQWGWTPATSVLLGGPQETAHEPEPESAPEPAPAPAPAPHTSIHKGKRKKGKKKKGKKKPGDASSPPTGDSTYPRRAGWHSRVKQAPADDDHHNHTPHARREDKDVVELPLRPRLRDDEIVELPQQTPWEVVTQGRSAQAGSLRRASGGRAPPEGQLRSPQGKPPARPAPALPQAPSATRTRDTQLAATVRELERLQSVLIRFQPTRDPLAHRIPAGGLGLWSPPAPQPAPPARSPSHGGTTHDEWEAGFTRKVQLLKNTLDQLRPPAPRPRPQTAPPQVDWLDAELPIDDWLEWLEDGVAFDEWLRGLEEEHRAIDEQQVAFDEWLRGSDERLRALREREAAVERGSRGSGYRPSQLQPATSIRARPSPVTAPQSQAPAPTPAPSQAPAATATASSPQLVTNERKMKRRVFFAEVLRVCNERHATTARESEWAEALEQPHSAPVPGALPSPAAEPRPRPPRAPKLYPRQHSRLSFSTLSTGPEGPSNGATAAPAPSGTRRNPRSAVTPPKARTVTTVPPTPASPSVAAAQEAAALLKLCMDPGIKQDEHERQQLLMLAAEVLQRQLGKGAKEMKEVKQVTEARAGGDCVICLETTADTVLVPCGHLVLCATCCRTMEIVGREVPRRKEVPCPICRTAVKDRVKVFRA